MTCNVFWEYSGVHRTPIITISAILWNKRETSPPTFESDGISPAPPAQNNSVNKLDSFLPCSAGGADEYPQVCGAARRCAYQRVLEQRFAHFERHRQWSWRGGQYRRAYARLRPVGHEGTHRIGRRLIACWPSTRRRLRSYGHPALRR